MKKWAERMDQPRLMKGFSLKCTAAGSRKKIKSLISSWSSSAALLHLVPLFLCSPPAFDSRMHTVELHHKLYGTFTSECRKVFCQSDVISWDASHNGCHCCSQWDSRMSCCHAKLLRNVCARGQTFCVSGPLFPVVAAFGRQPVISCGMWHFLLPRLFQMERHRCGPTAAPVANEGRSWSLGKLNSYTHTALSAETLGNWKNYRTCNIFSLKRNNGRRAI